MKRVQYEKSLNEIEANIAGAIYRLEFGGDSRIALYKKGDSTAVVTIDWNGIKSGRAFYKKSWENEEMGYRHRCSFDDGVTRLQVFSEVSSVGCFGINTVWYVAANGKKLAALHIKGYKRSFFRSGINCKFFYKTKNLNKNESVSSCVPLLWALLHFSDFDW